MPPLTTKRFIDLTPLTPAVFHILLALVHGQKHGYAIMQQVEADAAGSLHMGPGTLYGSLQRMCAAGLVEESEELGNDRRRYYRITGAGERALQAEIARLRQAVAAAKRKGIPVNARSAATRSVATRSAAK